MNAGVRPTSGAHGILARSAIEVKPFSQPLETILQSLRNAIGRHPEIARNLSDPLAEHARLHKIAGFRVEPFEQRLDQKGSFDVFDSPVPRRNLLVERHRLYGHETAPILDFGIDQTLEDTPQIGSGVGELILPCSSRSYVHRGFEQRDRTRIIPKFVPPIGKGRSLDGVGCLFKPRIDRVPSVIARPDPNSAFRPHTAPSK